MTPYVDLPRPVQWSRLCSKERNPFTGTKAIRELMTRLSPDLEEVILIDCTPEWDLLKTIPVRSFKVINSRASITSHRFYPGTPYATSYEVKHLLKYYPDAGRTLLTIKYFDEDRREIILELNHDLRTPPSNLWSAHPLSLSVESMMAHLQYREAHLEKAEEVRSGFDTHYVLTFKMDNLFARYIPRYTPR